MWYTYLLLCKDNSIYAGITNNLKKRLNAHRLGTASRYTRSRGVKKMIYAARHQTMGSALKAEYKLKQLGHLEKLALGTTFKNQNKIKLPK